MIRLGPIARTFNDLVADCHGPLASYWLNLIHLGILVRDPKRVDCLTVNDYERTTNAMAEKAETATATPAKVQLARINDLDPGDLQP